jgi:hypothetical protein
VAAGGYAKGVGVSRQHRPPRPLAHSVVLLSLSTSHTHFITFPPSEKHSSFASVFPIYLQTTTLSTVPKPPLSPPTSPLDEDEAQVEEELDEPETEEVEVVSYEQLNKAEPLWMRDPKTISDEEYAEFYKISSKDIVDPLLWSHFKCVWFLPFSLLSSYRT